MRTEKMIAALTLLGILFKVLHWPGAGFILVISLSILAILYFPLAFYCYADREIKDQNLSLSIVAGFFLSVIPVGILFKLMYWPGTSLYLLIGSLASLILFIIAYSIKNKDAALTIYYKNMKKRAVVLGIISFIFYITPMTTLLNIQYWNDPRLAEIAARSYQNPDNEEYREQLKEYRNRKYSQAK